MWKYSSIFNIEKFKLVKDSMKNILSHIFCMTGISFRSLRVLEKRPTSLWNSSTKKKKERNSSTTSVYISCENNPWAERKIKSRYLIYFGSCESFLLINSPLWRDTEYNTQVKAEFFYLVCGEREQKKTMDTIKKGYKECEWI